MAIKFVACRHTVTGAEVELPETALPHFTDYVPVDAEPTPEPAASAPKPGPASGTEAAKPTKKAVRSAASEEE